MLGLRKYEIDAKDISKKSRMKRKFSTQVARIELLLGYEKTPVFMEIPNSQKLKLRY